MMTKCLKCSQEVYCSRFCKDHFRDYFERKFKRWIRKLGGFKKGESISIVGENMELALLLMKPIVEKLKLKVSNKGRLFETFSLDYIASDFILSIVRGNDFNHITSLFEQFTDEEIESYSRLIGFKYSTPHYQGLREKIVRGLYSLKGRRPNIFYCTYNMINFFK